MRTMQFMPELSNFLLKNGFIYTVRKYRMRELNIIAEGAGLCRRIPLGEIEKEEDLEKYVLHSGFSTTSDWWRKIKEFIPGKMEPKYLYKIVRKESS